MTPFTYDCLEAFDVDYQRAKLSIGKEYLATKNDKENFDAVEEMFDLTPGTMRHKLWLIKTEKFI